MEFEKEFEAFMGGNDDAKAASKSTKDNKKDSEHFVALDGETDRTKVRPISKELDNRFRIAEKGGKTVYSYSNDPDKIAFTEKENKIIANDNNPTLIKSMIEIAESKGWQSITVSGDKDFKREAWLEAKTKGLEVKGFEPSEQDERKLQRLMEKQNTIEEEKLTPAQKSVSLMAQANKLRATGNDDKADELEADAALIAETLKADKNPFSEKEQAMLHRQFEKGKEGREVSAKENSDSTESIQLNHTDTSKPQNNTAIESKKSEVEAMPPISKEGRELREKELKTALQTLEKDEAIKKYPELENVYKVQPAAEAFYRAKAGLKEQEEDFKTKATDRAIEEVAAGRKIPDFDVSSYKAAQQNNKQTSKTKEAEIDFD